MGSATSRILGTKDPVEPSLYHRSADGVDFAAGAGGIGPQIPARSGHAYDNNFIGENARAHFGDVYNHSVTYEQPGFPNKDVISPSYKKFMSALSFHQMSFRFMAIDPAYVETSRWVLETAEFRQWRDRTLDSDSNIFWLKGKPGTGKSTIMQTITKYLEGEDPKSIVLSFFFNARGQSLEQSVEGLYRTMLHQLFSKVPRLLKTTNAVQIYADCAHEPTWSTELLRGLFSDAVLGSGQERIILVVDALDEGDEQEVRNMIEFARNLARTAHRKNVSLEICFASRHYPSITVSGSREVVVEEQAKHKRDIARYIRGTLNLDYEPSSYDFAEAIAQKARGVFLWVTLVVKLLNERYDHGVAQNELIATLEKIPPGLDDLLRSIISSGRSDKRLLPALLWIVCNVGKAFHVRELYVAIQVGIGARDEILNHGSLRSMHRYIISASKGLVELVSTGRLQQACIYAGNAKSGQAEAQLPEGPCCIVQFIHESVREHLLSSGLAELCPELLPDVEGKGHAMLARWYQVYMRSFFSTLNPFPTHPVTGFVIDDDQMSEKDIKDFRKSDSFALFERTVTSTFQHVRIAHGRGQPGPNIIQGFPIIQWANMKNIECIVHPSRWKIWHRSPHRLEAPVTLLYVLISERCQDVAIELCRDFPTVLTSTECDHTNLPVLDAAAGPEKNPLVRESLNIVCGGHYGSPLGAAVGTASIDMVELLLGCGADISFHGGPMGSPLQIAIRKQNMKMVQLLISDGRSVDPPSFPNGSEPCLFTAVNTRNYEMVKLLLDHGADIEKLAGQSHHLLWRAAYLENTNVLKLLLTREAPWIAASNGIAHARGIERKDKILRLLADRAGTATNVQALPKALLLAMRPHSKCRKLIFRDRDDVDPRTERELHQVQRHVCAEVTFPNADTTTTMRMLLDVGADPNALGEYFESPLIAAAIIGEELYGKILRSFGAVIYFRRDIYGTAEEMGWERIVELLLRAEEVGDSASTGGSETGSSRQTEDDFKYDRRWRYNPPDLCSHAGGWAISQDEDGALTNLDCAYPLSLDMIM